MATETMDRDDVEAGAEGGEEFSLKKAARHGLKALVLLYGHSGSGKTYSALRLARGLVGPKGKIGMLDTEHNRGLHYANEFDYEHAMMRPPFTPERYAKAVDYFERKGVDCMIVDSMSHVQEGEGGLLEMAEAEEKRMGNVGMGSQWKMPKAKWKRAVNRFLRSKMHIIFCARAKNPLEQDGDNKRKLKAGELTAIIPKNFEYEVMISIGMELDHSLIHVKMPNQLAGAFPVSEYISENSGRQMGAWLDGEKVIDHAFEDTKREGEAAARQGVLALKGWWSELGGNMQRRLQGYLKDTLKPMAEKGPAASGAGERDSQSAPARSERSPAPSVDEFGFPDITATGRSWDSVAEQIAGLIEAKPERVGMIEAKYAKLLQDMPPASRDIVTKASEVASFND